MSTVMLGLAVLVLAPIAFGALLWLLAVLEGDREMPGRSPFDPPQWW